MRATTSHQPGYPEDLPTPAPAETGPGAARRQRKAAERRRTARRLAVLPGRTLWSTGFPVIAEMRLSWVVLLVSAVSTTSPLRITVTRSARRNTSSSRCDT